MARTNTPTRTLAELEAEQLRLTEEAARMRAAADQARAAEAAKREVDLDEQARRTVKDYDHAALDAVLTDAEQRLRKAVLEDPIYAAAIDLYAARITRYEQEITTNAAAARINVASPAGTPRVGSLDLHEYVATLIAREAGNRAEDARERASA